MPARAIGTATISFGLVSIPVKLYTSTESGSDLSFNLLHGGDCGSRLKQQYICLKDGQTVERDQMVKGYEFTKGQYVMLGTDELKALDAVATNAVDIQEFVPAAKVDPVLVEKSYYLGPDKGGERAYRLIAEAMIASGLVGVASYSARGKQYVVALRPYQNGLVMHQLLPMMGADARTFVEHVSQSVPPLGSAADLSALLMRRDGIARAWAQFLAETPLILSPTWTQLPFEPGFDVATPEGTAATSELMRPVVPANLLGLPSACVPAGRDATTGLPVGVLLTGARFREDLCLDAAEIIEQQLGLATPIEPASAA